MERKTHTLFTVSCIYGGALVLKEIGIENEFLKSYVHFIYQLPIITLPFIAIVTSLPDVDLKNNRLNKTILAPAAWFLRIFVKHRGFTHRIEGIIAFGALLYLLNEIGTGLLPLAIVSLFAINIIWIIIDDFKIGFLRNNKLNAGLFEVEISRKLVDIVLTSIIIIYFPTLLVEDNYQSFLIALFAAYVLHMVGDAFSKEGWTIAKVPFSRIKLNFQLPGFLAFRVGGSVERKMIRPLLRISIFTIIYFDFDYISSRISGDFWLSMRKLVELI